MIDRETQIIRSPRITIYRNINPNSKRFLLSQSEIDNSLQQDSKQIIIEPIKKPNVLQKNRITIMKDFLSFSKISSSKYSKNLKPLHCSVVNMNCALSPERTFKKSKPTKSVKTLKLARNIHTANSHIKFKRVCESVLYKNDL